MVSALDFPRLIDLEKVERINILGPTTQQEVQRFMDTAARYGCWNASPRGNVRAGIALPVAPADR